MVINSASSCRHFRSARWTKEPSSMQTRKFSPPIRQSSREPPRRPVTRTSPQIAAAAVALDAPRLPLPELPRVCIAASRMPADRLGVRRLAGSTAGALRSSCQTPLEMPRRRPAVPFPRMGPANFSAMRPATRPSYGCFAVKATCDLWGVSSSRPSFAAVGAGTRMKGWVLRHDVRQCASQIPHLCGASA